MFVCFFIGVMLFTFSCSTNLPDGAIPRCRIRRNRLATQDSNVPTGEGLPEFPAKYSVIIPVRYVVLLKVGVKFNSSLVGQQHTVLNSNYAPTGFYFYKRDVIVINDDNLATNCDVDKSDSFRNDVVPLYAVSDSRFNWEVVTVFFCDLPYLGEATFPWYDPTQSTIPYVQINLAAMAGMSPDKYYREGKTLTHEMGHFLGLLHPFDSIARCAEPNDYVADTPQQLRAVSGCPANPIDSCPLNPGFDPVHNYMGYSDDSCMYEFTAGQRQRMQRIFRQYRPTLYSQGLIQGSCSWKTGECRCIVGASRCFLPGMAPPVPSTANSWPTMTPTPTPLIFFTKCEHLGFCNGHGRCIASASIGSFCSCFNDSVRGKFLGDDCGWCSPFTAGSSCSLPVPVSPTNSNLVSSFRVRYDAIPTPLQLAIRNDVSASDVVGYTVPLPDTTPEGYKWTGLSFLVLVTAPTNINAVPKSGLLDFEPDVQLSINQTVNFSSEGNSNRRQILSPPFVTRSAFEFTVTVPGSVTAETVQQPIPVGRSTTATGGSATTQQRRLVVLGLLEGRWTDIRSGCLSRVADTQFDASASILTFGTCFASFFGLFIAEPVETSAAISSRSHSFPIIIAVLWTLVVILISYG